MIAPLLDRRLLAVAEMVRGGSVAADIGADHGRLICHLVEAGVSQRGYACDIGELPLRNAAALIRLRGLEDRIQTVLTDGLTGLPMDEIDEIIIAGMGGELIAEILSCAAAREDRLRFVLQPMSKAERLRRLLYRMGFEIIKERGVASGSFIYTVMRVCYNGKAKDVDGLFAWTGRLFEDGGKDSLALLRQTSRRLTRAADGLSRSGGNEPGEREFREIAAGIDQKLTQGGHGL